MPFKKLLLCAFACAGINASTHAALIGHWTFDESSGSSASDTVGGKDGIWQPGSDATPDWKPAGGLFDGAIEFPGSGNHVNYFTVSDLPALNGTPAGMTVSVWVKAGAQSGYRGILMTRGVTDDVDSGRNYGLAHDGTGADGRVSGASVDSAAGTLVNNGEWIHLAWVWDNVSQNHKMYIDGQQSGPTQSLSGRTISANSDWRIGDDACCNNRNFNGLMDDLAVWDEALSASAVQQIYNNGLAGLAIGEEPPVPPTDPLDVGLVINEVHYDSEPKTEFVEFIELLNTNSTPLDIGGYAFTDGVTFTFPAGTMLGATEYLLLAENSTALAAKFGGIPAATQIFQYTGSLSNDGETLELRNATAAIIDTVDYRAEFPWPITPNGERDSMQLINATLDNNLGGTWRGALPTPGLPNTSFATTAPPIIRQVNHSPNTPISTEALTVTAKVTDPDGVASVSLLYQIVAPGAYIPAFFPQPYSQLLANPNGQGAANPAFENPANWTTLAMVDDGTATSTYTATIPAQAHRTLIRYRILAADSLAESVRVPYLDDESLNFAAFAYDGVPDYVAGNTTHSAAVLTKLPIYHMITRDEDRSFAFAYSSTGDGGFQIGKGHPARGNYNWECALVYDGVVYDHVGWRLRQNNDRYAGNGKRSMRFRMNRGHYFQARGEDGKKLSVKWRRFNTSKMSRFGGTNSYGLYETINSKLWRMVGVECPYFLPGHWRMIDGVDEAPDQYNGDFFGFTTVVQDIDGRLLDERGLPNGNMYKLKDGASNPLDLQRNQTRTAVTDGSDFTNIKDNLDDSQTDSWLNDHVDWNQWARYHAVVEAVRHYDYGTPSTHFKNRAWYFKESAGTPHGLLRIVPHDHDASWSKGYHDNLNSVGNSIGTGFPWSAVFNGITRPPSSEKADFARNYRNFIREFRQLLWQEETVNTIIDDHVSMLQDFTLADRDRWVGGPSAAGSESMTAIENISAPMKSMGFISDTVYGANLLGGRGAFLDQIAADTAIPDQPTISYSGSSGFPAGNLQFTSSAFSDPQGSGTFSSMQWRIAEVTDNSSANDIEILPRGSDWKYLDDGSDQGTAWREIGFNDASFLTGATPAGYGSITNTNLATQINFGGTPSNRFPTTYFRTTVNITDPADFVRFNVSLNLDDGAVVYVNGQEVLRDGIDLESLVAFNTFADENGNEGIYDTFTIPTSAFVTGNNVIAVEVHNRNAGSGDLGFDMEIFGVPAVTKRQFEWIADWESGSLTPFQSTIKPPAVATRPGLTYRARVRHQDATLRWSEWSEPLEFIASEPDISLFKDSLVISEIMYHPADPSAAEIAAGFDDDDFFEYIEIRNVGTQTIDLDNVRFTKGIDIDLSGTIAPGAFALVVNNVIAFEMRYGAGLPVLGEWSGKLNNGGEQLKLSFGAGLAIRDFVYDDVAPWPTSPDGDGSSLVLVHPFSLPDHGSPYSWRAGIANPGISDGTTFAPGGNLLAYAIQGQPTVILLPDGNLALSAAINQLAEDIIIQPQVSTDLANWQDADFPVTAVQPTTLAYATTTFSTLAPPSTHRWYVRWLISLR